ncbi:ABC transporter substrate-binding protein [Actinomadura barringtoniae]|uniref:ABC transporter substrate-binding protein n=1 Tax=Actinomadura barringtoniae TaxID=1427535 RepID=A0A939PET5_9ACTN|nr:ABC transporter substrate-binding protein [Actinomadura barringtoniae]MBO2451250.1 ABC transporter substrate-binding protein [Actinomadura barringtoniae]
MDSVRSRVLGTLTAAAMLVSSAACAGGSDAYASPAPGVTKKACPHAVNKKHGCIYLGVISDLTSGPFKALGVASTRAEQAFWERVNRQGGIGGYDVDVTTYVRDNHYDVATHRKAFEEIQGKVLALAQTLGSPQTDAILEGLHAAKMIAVPASWTSKWEFEDAILESGTSYCFESMNAVDYMAQNSTLKKTMAVHYSGDYGDDAAAGAKVAADAHGLTHVDVKTAQGSSKAAVDAIVREKPDLVMLTTGPADAAVIVGESVARGFKGSFVGSNPSWDKSLLKGPAAKALKTRYLLAAPWKPFATDDPGHTAMRAALGEVDPNDSFTAGWTESYPLKAVLQRAADDKKLTREGVLDALKQTTFVDYEGILPKAAGNFSGDPNSAAFRQSVIGRPDDREFTGIKIITDFFAGRTAQTYRLGSPCNKTS